MSFVQNGGSLDLGPEIEKINNLKKKESSITQTFPTAHIFLF
jgi:hypothetical protein